MKTKLKLPAVSLLLSVFCLSAFAQGSLTPPGAPAPTMKTLDQIEARTAITNTTSLVTISQPGSYYLIHNLTVSTGDGVDINTNGVTLDLNGFTIRSTAASAAGYGISLSNVLRNITILNGFIQGGVTNNGSGIYNGSGFDSGIKESAAVSPANVLVSRVSISGCLNDGIFMINSGDSTVVESCTVRTVGGFGIFASIIKNCSAIDCGDTAIVGRQVSDCRAQSTGGSGLSAETALNCNGQSSLGTGISATIAQNCYGYCSSGGTGLSATTTANNCYGTCGSGSGTGLNVSGGTAQNCVGSSGGSGTGLNVPGGVATGCYGYSISGIAITAQIANSCIIGHGTTNITFKYNMP